MAENTKKKKIKESKYNQDKIQTSKKNVTKYKCNNIQIHKQLEQIEKQNINIMKYKYIIIQM